MSIDKNVLISPKEYHRREIKAAMNGFWAQDVWNWHESPLKEFYYASTSSKRRDPCCMMLRFDKITNPYLRNEVKFYFYHKMIVTNENSPVYVWNMSPYLQHLFLFIEYRYPSLSSIVDAPYEKFILQFRTFLEERGLQTVVFKRKTDRKDKEASSKHPSRYISVFRLLYEFYYVMYDERDEFDKDVWDVRKLGMNHRETETDYMINFISTPLPFRRLLKEYMKERVFVTNQIVYTTGRNIVRYLQVFFNFLYQKYPAWTDLTLLSRGDILSYLTYLRETPDGLGNTRSDYGIRRGFSFLQTFLDYIQINEWPQSPEKNIRALIQPSDYPKEQRSNKDKIKHIPDSVWEQLVQNIDRLSSDLIPIVILLEATGFRISDLLLLKFDCLEYTHGGWWVRGDQSKVKYKDHRVPISEEVAQVVKAQQEFLRTTPNIELINTRNLLFPNLRNHNGTNIGHPYKSETVSSNLHRLAKRVPIVDEKGDIFWFNNHAFRHRYGITLINNGMNILHVKKLMAHASPEMTLIYAQILDSTLMEAWKKTKQNVLRITTQGELVPANLEQQAEENGVELEWIRQHLDSTRLDHGYCIKPQKLNCEYLQQAMEPPCIKGKCRSFHVDVTFLPYYQEQIKKMELDLVIYRRNGRERQIEWTISRIETYRGIIQALQDQGGVYGLSKGKREYIGEERT